MDVDTVEVNHQEGQDGKGYAAVSLQGVRNVFQRSYGDELREPEVPHQGDFYMVKEVRSVRRHRSRQISAEIAMQCSISGTPFRGMWRS